MDEAVADYQTGLSSVAVGKKYGIDPQTVLNNLRTRGIASRPRRRPAISGKALAKARVLRDAGQSYEAIGQRFGVSRTAAANAVK